MTAGMRPVKHRSRNKDRFECQDATSQTNKTQVHLGSASRHRSVGCDAKEISNKRQGGQLKEGGGSSTPAFMPPGCLRTAPVAGRSKQPECLRLVLNMVRRSSAKFIHAMMFATKQGRHPR